MNEMRLQKWLSQLGIASRREAEKWISDRRIAVNGKVVTELGTKVNPESDTIAVDGKAVKPKLPPKVYWLLNKPDKHLTARSDELTNKKTIYDIPMVSKAKFLVNPVGRLDFRTEGLLLLTNDGELSYKLCRPEYHVPREYQALLDSRLTKEQEQEIKKGITLEDGPVKDIKLQFVHGTNMGVSTGSWYVVTVHEGRNRLVRRLFEHFGKRVVRLVRVGFGEIRLPAELPAGEYRQLTTEEVASLRRATEKVISEGEPARRISRSKGRSLRKPLSQRLESDAKKVLKPGARKPQAEKIAAKPATKNPEARRSTKTIDNGKSTRPSKPSRPEKPAKRIRK
jgi:23S rRNA pseudouridine2605 synthase